VLIASSIWVSDYPSLAYVQAFAEASVVGACADWFAVVALFRHPMGLPIPHTAILPRSKSRIAETLSAFICNNFLEPQILRDRLVVIDAAGWWSRWLEKPANIDLLARQFAELMPQIADFLTHREVHDAIRDGARQALGTVPASPLAGQTLGVIVRNGLLMVAADWLFAKIDLAVMLNSDAVREHISKHTMRWVPKWLDNKLADRLITGIHTTIEEMRQPGHPWRYRLEEMTQDFAARLEHDPGLYDAGERIKADVLANPLVADQIDAIWHSIELGFKSGSANEAKIRAGTEYVLRTTSELLANDEHLREQFNEWVRSAITAAIGPNRDAIGHFISDVVSGWDEQTLVTKLELQVGKDLQYIRINGTVVGGMVGLAIYAAHHFLSAFDLTSLLQR
jgi:uncharacterized membrane-anchored protein YjiN (DUF445 family)